MLRLVSLAAVAGVMLLTVACGGDDDAGSVSVPEGATFCSVFTGEYRDALTASPVADESAASELAKWAEVLVVLAPAEIAEAARDNLEFIKAFTSGDSPEEFADGSFEFNEWAGSTCSG